MIDGQDGLIDGIDPIDETNVHVNLSCCLNMWYTIYA